MRSSHDANPIQLNIELGGEFLLSVVERFGIEGWNRWIEAMTTGGLMPQEWSPDEAIPACWYWLNFTGGDFSRRNWCGINLGLPYLENCDFDECTLAGATVGCCPMASFRGADLRDAGFVGDISAADFSDAHLDGIQMDGAAYVEGLEPVGLPVRLLRLCQTVPAFRPAGTGEVEHPVPIIGSLTALSVQGAR